MDKKRPSVVSAVYFDQVTCQADKCLLLDHVSLAMRYGSITGVLGPNGAGKTTLLHTIMGLRQPSSGTVTVLNERLPVRGKKLRLRMGVVFQETSLYDELTTVENLQFAASLYAVTHPQRRISEVLDLLGLSERKHDRVRDLSGGLRRRVAIARALLHAPDLLIVDEPTLGVDVEARHAIWSHLRYLKSSGTTVVVSTNYLDEALALCDMVAVLRMGRLLTFESPASLVARAGSCLDVECVASAVKEIVPALTDVAGILRIDQTSSGVSLFLSGSTVPEDIIRLVLETATINGFRVRSADLAEVFRALDEVLP